MSRTTKPSPSDQAQPVKRPASLAELAMAQGIDALHVGMFLRDQSAYLSAPYRFATSDIGLVSL